MRKRVSAMAAAGVVGLGAAVALAIPATATSSAPGAPGAGATTTPTATGSPGTPSPTGTEDKDTVCLATAKTVTNGLNDFVAQMKQASTLAQQGNLSGAEAQVKAGGARLVAIGNELKAEGVKAADPQVASTVSTISSEFQTLGKSLTSLSSLQSFDSTKLDAAAAKMSQICGTSGPTPFPT